MAIIDVIREVCPVIGLAIPESVFGSTEREHIELSALANEMAKRIAFDGRDWTKLKVYATIEGDGVAFGFDLPPDYKRMLKKGSIWPSGTPFSPLVHYPDSDRWLGLEVQNFNSVIGAYTFMGDQIMVKPLMSAGSNIKFAYITKNIIKDKDGGKKFSFTADTDVFRLDERILKLGMIWQWKANKGQQYAEDMSTYEDALAVEAGADKGSNILVVGRTRTRNGSDPAYPGVILP